ncbi:MAG: type II-A CRISPR-associated protein Csn2 [Sedimentibacter saalensis]|uniref:type II-A CRISPR-associated protein Csn2 n=1 Tax=Sedimentibacter saalensis TaxID=130788 RepID=UPI002B213464|nr:type II-A CRISPR-associated protein Csn2 [Sedimentibacter saalensis]MEA5094585.1 type II-A CRISPR-associated protein Csn2 [Sedimentibacter saalensis]
MKMTHPYFENPLLFEENKINVLVIENQYFFVKFINELLNQLNGIEGRFILSSNYKQLEINKEVDLVIDPFTLDFNQRKIITKLYEQLKSNAIGSEYYLDSKILLGEIMQFIEKLSQTTQYPLVYTNDLDIISILKIAEIKLETSYDTLVEKIVDYCSVIQEFCCISCVIFVNLKCFLSNEELELFYKTISYKKINIMLLENTVREKRFEQEKIYIIDSDLCEIS